MLLQLSALPQIPGANSVVETTGPQLSAVVGYVDTASTISMALELPAVKIRHQTTFITVSWPNIQQLSFTAIIQLHRIAAIFFFSNLTRV